MSIGEIEKMIIEYGNLRTEHGIATAFNSDDKSKLSINAVNQMSKIQAALKKMADGN